MLKRLKETTHGFPADLTEDSWNEILDKMILGFAAGKRIIDSENWVMNEGSDIRVDSSGKCTFTNPLTEDQVKHYRELDEEDKKTFDEGMKLFHERFFSLWD
jgi:hypothetical protein